MDHKDFGGLLLACALAAPLPASADDIFLKLQVVRGDSVDERHKGEIDILSYSQSLTGPFAPATAGGAAAGKTTCGPVTIMKYVDASSPSLIIYAARGKSIGSGIFTFRKAGATPLEYYRVTLDDVIITQVQQSDSKSGSSQRATETVSLIGRRIKYEYISQDPKAGGSGGSIFHAWDCVGNKDG